MATDTFPRFASLPKELRLQIWGAALNPRVIVLHRSSDRNMGRYYFPFGAAPVKIPLFMALTTHDPSLDIIFRVCAESKIFCRKRYMELDVWDIRKNCLGTFYDPSYDVVSFSHHINPSLLREFASQYPLETNCMETLALPGTIAPSMFSGADVLADLRIFESLKEVIIVSGSVPRRENALAGGPALVPEFPYDAESILERIKAEQWPDWKLPSITIVASHEDILGRENTANGPSLYLAPSELDPGD